LKCKAARPASLSTLPSTYDDFLYAPVGESIDGAWLTVLSVLARQNVDPWEEAAELSRMPHDIATRRLISMITASPGSNAHPAAAADRLVGLLPRHIAAADVAPNVLQGEPAARRSPRPVSLMVIAIYILVMVLGQWLASSIFEKAPANVASVPSPGSAPGETADARHRTDDSGEVK
jgi:hypothetical protein